MAVKLIYSSDCNGKGFWRFSPRTVQSAVHCTRQALCCISIPGYLMEATEIKDRDFDIDGQDIQDDFNLNLFLFLRSSV